MLLHIYTKDYGKVEAVARSARKAKGKLKGHLELFLDIDIILARGRNIDTITSSLTIESFSSLRNCLEFYFGACYILELVDKMTVEWHKDERIFYLLKKALLFLNELAEENNYLVIQLPQPNYPATQKRNFVISSISEKSAVSAISPHTDFSPMSIGARNDNYWTVWQLDNAVINKYYLSILLFQIHLLNLSGFSPELNKCVFCSKSIKPRENYFSFKLGGIVSKECVSKNPDAILISDNMIKLLRLFQFKGGKTKEYNLHLNKCFKTLEKLKADKRLILNCVFLMNKFIEFNADGKIKAIGLLDFYGRKTI